MQKILLMTIGILLSAAVPVLAEPRLPTNDEEIIESLPIGAPSGLALTTATDITLDQAIVSASASRLLGQRYSDQRQ